MAIVNAGSLTLAAQTYDPTLRTLPYFELEAIAKKLGMNVISLTDENIMVSKRRKAGGTGPYKIGVDIKYQPELMKFFESKLKPELTYYAAKDNIHNYKEKKILVLAGSPVDNKSKQHPLEFMILKDMVISHGEDIAFALFTGERDDAVFTPETAFTGFFPTLDALTTAGFLSAGLKNIVNTGAFADPVDANDTSAYEKLVTFIGSADPMLRSSRGGIPQLLITETVIKAARAALRNKLKLIAYPSAADLLTNLREDAFCPSLEFSTDEIYGQGGKLILQKKGNMDIGFNNQTDGQFVQTRFIYEDPNECQFWLQAAYGVRFHDVHKKVFQTNEQINTVINLAGDY